METTLCVGKHYLSGTVNACPLKWVQLKQQSTITTEGIRIPDIRLTKTFS